MPGTIKIWWHDGAVTDVRHHDLPVVNEPELGFESLPVDVTPSQSGPAPVGAVVAIVESTVNVRYVVRRPGQTGQANADSKPIRATPLLTEPIGVAAGDTISFIEV